MEWTFPRACVICRNNNNIYIKSNFRLSRCSTTSHPTWQYNAREYEKKRSEIRKHCVPKIFAPPQTPFSEAQDRQNFISWRWSLPAPSDRVW